MSFSKQTLFVISLLAATAANTVLAEGKPTLGVKAGIVDIDVGGYDPTLSAGALLGIPVNQYFSVEGEFTKTATDGDFTALDPYGTRHNLNWSLWTVGAYAVYRTPGNLYLKGKLGVLYEDTSLFGSEDDLDALDLVNENGSISDSSANLSIGLGGGYHFNKTISLEAEITRIDSDATFISGGVNFHP